MKKILWLVAFLPFAATVTAQKGKPAPKKTTPATTKTAATLTNADANNFIRYTNSVSNFLESSYITRPFLNSYEVLATNIDYKGKGSYNTALPQIDIDFFKNQYDDFNSTFRNNSNDNYVALEIPPAKMGADKVAKFKTAWTTLQAMHTDLATYYNNTVMAVFPKSLPKKRNGADEQAALEQLKGKLTAIEDKKAELYDLSEELGQMAEAITLAKHPMKNEIMDIRYSLKTAKEIAKLVQVNSRDDYETARARVATLAGTLKELQSKYSNYSTNTKNNKEYAMRHGFKEYYRDNMLYFLESIEAFEKANDDRKVSDDWWKSKMKSVHGNFEGLVGKYESIVEMNNR